MTFYIFFPKKKELLFLIFCFCIILCVFVFQLTCDEPAGVNAIREALLKGEEASNEFPDIKIECKVKATPYYTIETITDEKDKGLKIVGAGIPFYLQIIIIVF